MKRRKWTMDEELYLEMEFGKYGSDVLAKELNRSISSINSKAIKMGLSRNNNQEWLTVSDFCRLTRIHRSTIQFWIETSDFPSTRIHKYRRVYPDKFWKWAEVNKQRINWKDFPQHMLGKEPAWVEIARKATKANTGRRRYWTEEEIKELEYLLKQEKYTYPELSKRLDRTHSAIKRKIYDLNLPWPLYLDRHTSSAKPYTESEIEAIIQLYQEGMPLIKIARRFKRSEVGIQDKLRRSGYRFESKQLLKVE